jgi:hypothetical protein
MLKIALLGSKTIIEFDINGEIFTAKGLMVEQLNYLEVYPYERWTDKTLPVFQEGEEIMPSGSDHLRITQKHIRGLLTHLLSLLSSSRNARRRNNSSSYADRS